MESETTVKLEAIFSMGSVLATAADALSLIAWSRASRGKPHRLAPRPVGLLSPRALKGRERPNH